MKIYRFLSAFLMVVIVQSCCISGNGGNGSSNGNQGGSTPQPIGSVQRVRSLVQSGSQNALEEVTGTKDLYNGQAVKVTQGGSAKLQFGNQIGINLFNDSELGGVKVEATADTPNWIVWKLVRGGISGQVAQPGGKLEISVQTGAKITVLGTRFFMIYDPSNDYVVAGNFDGDVNWSFQGGTEQPLLIGEMIDISATGETNLYPIPFGPDDFDRIIDSVGSPIEALYGLRREFQIPLPGEKLATEPPGQAYATRALVWPEGDYFVPDLAASWEVSEDGGAWYFHLRDDVRMPEGGPFNSKIVLERFQDWQWLRDGWVKVEAVDDYTVIVYIAGGYAGLKERGFNQTDFLEQIAELTFKVQQ